MLLVSTLVQLPALALLSSLLGPALGPIGTALPYVVAACITGPYLVLSLGRPFADEPKPRWLSHLSLWPFFAWWATASIYCVLYPLGVLGAHVLGTTAPLHCALGLSSLAGLWAVRRTPRIVELDVEVADLPAAFDGYRIGQISDVHCGSLTPRSRVESWVATLNGARPDLIAITGDLVTSGDHYIDDVAAALRGLDAPDGVMACMGNHDYFCDAERLVRGLRDGGVRVLRNEGTRIARDGATLFVGGIEDTWSRRNDLVRTLRDRRQGEASILLAHDPNIIHEAALADVGLQLSGHTHGGQMALPIRGGRYNLARLITRYTHGLHRVARAALYVSRGVGTTGPPLRLFAPADLTLITLRSAAERA